MTIVDARNRLQPALLDRLTDEVRHERGEANASAAMRSAAPVA